MMISECIISTSAHFLTRFYTVRKYIIPESYMELKHLPLVKGKDFMSYNKKDVKF